jgi:hypothetical protein
LVVEEVVITARVSLVEVMVAVAEVVAVKRNLRRGREPQIKATTAEQVKPLAETEEAEVVEALAQWVLTALQYQLAVLVERVLQVHLILSNEAEVAVVEANRPHRARVAQVVAEQVLPTTLITGLMEP